MCPPMCGYAAGVGTPETLLARPEVSALVERGAADRCVELSELSALIETLELGDEEVDALGEQLAARGIEVRDDCGRDDAETSSYRNGDLAETTTDAGTLLVTVGLISRSGMMTACVPWSSVPDVT